MKFWQMHSENILRKKDLRLIVLNKKQDMIITVMAQEMEGCDIGECFVPEVQCLLNHSFHRSCAAGLVNGGA